MRVPLPDNMNQITECALALIERQYKEMKTSTFIKILIWFIINLFVIDWSFELVSTNNTFLNIIGFVLFATHIFISVKTNCYTTIKITKK